MTAEETAIALARYEKILSDRHSPTLAHLLPGATQIQLDNAAEHLGVPVPEELRALWAWHNGTDSEMQDSDVTIANGHLLMSVDQAIRYGREWVSIDACAYGEQSELQAKILLDLTYAGRERLMVDAAKRSPNSSVVMASTEWSWSEVDLGISLAQVFDFWSDAIEEGFFSIDPVEGWVFNDIGPMPFPQRFYL